MREKVPLPTSVSKIPISDWALPYVPLSGQDLPAAHLSSPEFAPRGLIEVNSALTGAMLRKNAAVLARMSSRLLSMAQTFCHGDHKCPVSAMI